MRIDFYGKAIALPAFTVDTRTDGTVNGTTVDRGYNANHFRATLFVIFTGTITDGEAVFKVQESDNGTDWTDVPAHFVTGTLPTVTSSDSDKIWSVGYIGSARYVRLSATVSDSTDGGTWGAVAICTDARREPVRH